MVFKIIFLSAVGVGGKKILSGSGFTTWQTRQIQSPKLLAGCGVTSGRRFGLAQFSNGL
jgi:hypothetical protein